MSRVFGRDNAQFARQLFRRGYPDLAEKFCAAFEANEKVDVAEKAAVRSVYLDLRLEEARDENDPLKRKEMVKEVLRSKEEFIKNYPGSPEAQDAEEALPDGYRILCEAITEVLRKTTDEEAIKQLRNEGNEAFNHADEVLRKRKRQLDAQLQEMDLSDDAVAHLSDQRAVTWYNLARTEYFRSLLFTKDDPQCAFHLRGALRAFQEFGLENEDKLLFYEGLVIQGLCDRGLGSIDQALQDFNDAIALRERYIDEKGVSQAPPEVDDVVSSAVLQKMILLNDLDRGAEAIECAKDFVANSLAPEKAQFGLAVIALQADAELKTGDVTAAQASANRLLELDPAGPWGNRGREILGQMVGGRGGPSMGSAQLLKIAEALIAKEDYAGAARICGSALEAARGTEGAADASVDVLLMLGVCYAKMEDLQAAAIVLDEAVSRFPKAEKTAEALYRSVVCYSSLYRNDKKAFFRKRVDERRLRLANDYPTSPRAAAVQLMQGQSLADDQKFAEAADFYLKVQPGTPSYEDAQFLGGRCLVQEAQRLIKSKQQEAVKPIALRADTQLRKAMQILDAAAPKTLDLEQRARWETEAFECRTLLANLYMLEGVGRQADVAQLLEGIEERFGSDLDKVGTAWTLRIQALNALGRLGDAEQLLEALLQKSADSKSAAKAAGVFARSCDARAVELLGKDPKSKEGDDYWRKAYRYYVVSMRDKRHDPAAARSGELDSIATRYFFMGKHFNGVPDRVQSFLGWQGGKVVAPEYWEEAAELYEASLSFIPSYLTSINRARCLGFLGRWKEAGEAYAKLFDQENFVDSEKGELNKQLLTSRPALLTAYLEWGVVEFRVAKDGNEPDKLDRYARANVIFDRVGKNAKNSAKDPNEIWWQAKYWQLRALIDEGEYKQADLVLNDLLRTTNEEDSAKFGLKEEFKKMQDELAKKPK